VTKLRFYAVLLIATLGTFVVVAAAVGPLGLSDGGGL
jgi:hypothetical protein